MFIKCLEINHIPVWEDVLDLLQNLHVGCTDCVAANVTVYGIATVNVTSYFNEPIKLQFATDFLYTSTCICQSHQSCRWLFKCHCLFFFQWWLCVNITESISLIISISLVTSLSLLVRQCHTSSQCYWLNYLQCQIMSLLILKRVLQKKAGLLHNVERTF